jgi:hypothetical protein
MNTPDFANILFGGPCNRQCPFCIGQQLPAPVRANNLDVFPPLGVEKFVEAVNARGIRQIVFTGTTTDPQLYRHEAQLLDWLRARIPQATYSLHSNGAVALRKMATFNLYDKACISFPSFEAGTYARLMGSRRVPDLAEIVRRSRIPVKVSSILTEANVAQTDSFLARCHAIGVERVVLRRLFGETRAWAVLPDRQPHSFYRGNPVYDWSGMEVTCWNFDTSESTSINLFADGTLGSSYLLTQTPEFVPLKWGSGRSSPPRGASRPQSLSSLPEGRIT